MYEFLETLQDQEQDGSLLTITIVEEDGTRRISEVA